jgi:hypothetical protein
MQEANGSVQGANATMQEANGSVQGANGSVQEARIGAHPANATAQQAKIGAHQANGSAHQAKIGMQKANVTPHPANVPLHPGPHPTHLGCRSVARRQPSARGAPRRYSAPCSGVTFPVASTRSTFTPAVVASITMA